MKNPTSQLAREIIANGEIGEVVHFYGTHNEDYLADPRTPIDWHCRRASAGLGALGIWRRTSSIWPTTWWAISWRFPAICRP